MGIPACGSGACRAGVQVLPHSFLQRILKSRLGPPACLGGLRGRPPSKPDDRQNSAHPDTGVVHLSFTSACIPNFIRVLPPCLETPLVPCTPVERLGPAWSHGNIRAAARPGHAPTQANTSASADLGTGFAATWSLRCCLAWTLAPYFPDFFRRSAARICGKRRRGVGGVGFGFRCTRARAGDRVPRRNRPSRVLPATPRSLALRPSAGPRPQSHRVGRHKGRVVVDHRAPKTAPEDLDGVQARPRAHLRIQAQRGNSSERVSRWGEAG